MSSKVDRRAFLRSSAVAGLGAAGLLGSAEAAGMMKQKPEAKDLIKVGFVGIGNQGSGHVRNLLRIKGCQITAVCDIRPQRTKWASEQIVKAGFPAPKVYGTSDRDFERMCEKEDLDLVYNAAPWRWHAPISLSAMQNGAHAASEVNIALSVEDCWKIRG